MYTHIIITQQVSEVTSRLICGALEEIDLNGEHGSVKQDARHPFVGLVDHVSVMPMMDSSQSCDSLIREAAARVAREIGAEMSQANLVNVHYYGAACPDNTPLATVRRKNTAFFRSGGAVQAKSDGTKPDSGGDSSRTSTTKGDSIVGVPQHFVENFNVRLTSNVSFQMAKTLTEHLRGRNNGVAGVEALTLPYIRNDGKVYEVACNLTNPSQGNADDIKSYVVEWVETQRRRAAEKRAFDKAEGYKFYVEDAYRVGTTEHQCREVLFGNKTTKDWLDHDEGVQDRFRSCFGG